MPMTRRGLRPVAVAIVGLALAACGAHPEPSTAFRIEPPVTGAAAGQAEPLFTVHLDGAGDLLARLAKTVTTVPDPVYKQAQTYETVALTALIDAARPAGVASGVVSNGSLRLVLLATDGYRSVTTIEAARRFDGRIAIRDLKAEPGHAWRPIPDKPAMTPAPYYLVWPSANPDLPWPYAVTEIEVWNVEPIDLTNPGADAAAVAGHAIFKKRCFSCHAVNGAGGSVGPELNVPANVTEYWNHAALKQFILNPASIRRNPKMPTLTELTDADVDTVVTYLVHMKGLKVTRR
jgi:mono/diheme cytochrome c family protein